MKILAVMIDNREPSWVQELKFDGASKLVTSLDVGDVWLATEDMQTLIVERKTPDDFLGSLASGRLFIQAKNLQDYRASGYWPYIMISGTIQKGTNGKAFTGHETGFIWESVEGAKLSLQEMGIYVIECAGDTDFEAALIRLVNRSREKIINIPPSRKGNVLGTQAGILCGLPGIGPEKVEQILDYCGTAAHALAELTNDLSDIKIPGVGPGLKNNARWALGLQDNEFLAVLDKEILQEGA